jgi:uncharacterized protein (DUF58 family)
VLLTTADILKKVRELEIVSKKLTANRFTGEYHSAFRGRGMLFKEVRDYQQGDDIRFIDWNVSARFNHTFSKVFEEERELTVFFLVDISASALFGTVQKRKRDLITEICAVLAFSAINNNDKAGLVFFSDTIEQYINAAKGRDHVLYMVRQLLTLQPKQPKTDIAAALKFIHATSRQKSIVFILSDFIDDGYDAMLKIVARHHDCIGIKVYDPVDVDLPDAGLLQVQDLETGQRRWVDSSDEWTRYHYHKNFFDHFEKTKRIFLQAGSDLLNIRTNEDYVKILQQFFIRRIKK